MPRRCRRERAGKARQEGRERATFLAGRLGVGVHDARRALRLKQGQVASAAGITQSWESRMERGLGASASLETWCAVSAAVGEQLAAFLEHAPGADRPRDYQHLLRQRLVIETAVSGGWRSLPEEPIDDHSERSRAVDVLLLRAQKREAAAVECVDFLDDVGAAMRGLDAKVAALERRLTLGRDVTEAGWRVSGVLVVRRTRRNRQLVREFASVFVAKFAASPNAWLGALTDPSRPMPNDLGFLWTDVPGTRLMAGRLHAPLPPA